MAWRRSGIIWTNDVLVYGRINASLNLDELQEWSYHFEIRQAWDGLSDILHIGNDNIIGEAEFIYRYLPPSMYGS